MHINTTKTTKYAFLPKGSTANRPIQTTVCPYNSIHKILLKGYTILGNALVVSKPLQHGFHYDVVYGIFFFYDIIMTLIFPG